MSRVRSTCAPVHATAVSARAQTRGAAALQAAAGQGVVGTVVQPRSSIPPGHDHAPVEPPTALGPVVRHRFGLATAHESESFRLDVEPIRQVVPDRPCPPLGQALVVLARPGGVGVALDDEGRVRVAASDRAQRTSDLGELRVRRIEDVRRAAFEEDVEGQLSRRRLSLRTLPRDARARAAEASRVDTERAESGPCPLPPARTTPRSGPAPTPRTRPAPRPAPPTRARARAARRAPSARGGSRSVCRVEGSRKAGGVCHASRRAHGIDRRATLRSVVDRINAAIL